MRWLRWFDRQFLAPAPAERLATVRILTGAFALCYLLLRGHVLADFRAQPGRFSPVGLALILSSPLPPWTAFVLYAACVCTAATFMLGVRYQISAPLFALLLLWVTSYRNSWGMIFHNENLLVLHAIALAFTDAAAVLSWDARKRGLDEPVQDAGRFGWPLQLMSALTALAYVLAGVAKLKVTGLGWADGEVLREQIAYDALRKSQIGSVASPFAGFLVQLSWPYPVLSWLTLVLELAGPFLLWSRPLRSLWAVGLWAFHLGVLLSMAIAFPYPLSGLAFASLFRCERLWRLPWLGGVRRFLSPAGLQTDGARVRLQER